MTCHAWNHCTSQASIYHKRNSAISTLRVFLRPREPRPTNASAFPSHAIRAALSLDSRIIERAVEHGRRSVRILAKAPTRQRYGDRVTERQTSHLPNIHQPKRDYRRLLQKGAKPTSSVIRHVRFSIKNATPHSPRRRANYAPQLEVPYQSSVL